MSAMEGGKMKVMVEGKDGVIVDQGGQDQSRHLSPFEGLRCVYEYMPERRGYVGLPTDWKGEEKNPRRERTGRSTPGMGGRLVPVPQFNFLFGQLPRADASDF